jgi:hypothetical protein
MRFRPASLLLFPLFLTACEPSLQSGPRVEFVGSSRFNPSSRRLTVPGDTVAVKVYAEAESDDAPLTHLVIRAEYQPTLLLIDYPVDYNEEKAPKSSLVYLDTLIADSTRFAFQSVQPTRTSGGRETWQYAFTDTKSNTGARSFFLRLGRTDSAAAYHSYTVPLQAPGAFGRRTFLALREGLTLPSFSLRRIPENQQLVDLVYVPPTGTATAPSLATTTDAALKLPWTGRATQIRSTTLTSTDFTNATTAAQLTALFNQGTAFIPATRTGPLTKGQIIAFKTPTDKYGLLLINDIITTGIRSLVVQVRVTK